MIIPVTQKFSSKLSPWQVYQNLYAKFEISFFLDTPTSSDKAHSYLGASPFIQVVIEDGKLKISGEVKKTAPAKKWKSTLRQLFKKYQTTTKTSPFFQGGAVGYWGYELLDLFEAVKLRRKKGAKTPDLFLGFYRNLVVYDHKKKHYWLVANIQTRSKEIAKKKAKEQFELMKGWFQKPAKTKSKFLVKNLQSNMTSKAFQAMVKKAQKHIEAGDIYQANLSQRFQFDVQGSPLELYDRLRKINPSPFASFLKLRDIHIISSSPERLIQKKGRFCKTEPIAGTRPRKKKGKGEKQLKKELLLSPKERAEHMMLVDLERNDLGRVCEPPSVKVKDMMRVEKYSHVIHLVSEVVGKLQSKKDAFDLIEAMFPGGTITGCPKVRCMQLIDEFEPVKRGIYTGSIGYLDFKQDLDLNIVIRTMVLQKKKGYLQVGAGIVYDSKPQKEYEETLHKAEALFQALGKK